MSGYITDDGSVLAAYKVAARVGELAPDVKLEDYAVGVLGYVWFEARDLGYRIRFRPDRIAAKAEAALYMMLADPAIRRVLVTLVSDTGQRNRMHSSGAEAIAGIGADIAEVRRKRSPRFAKQPVNIRSLDRYPALQHLLGLYWSNGTTMEPNRLQEMASETLYGRYLLVQRDDDDGLRIKAVGTGYGGFDAQWSHRSRGSRIEDQPDLEYGAWLAQGYRSALAEKVPQVDVVDAIIFRPRLGRRRFGYRRLVLPFRDPTGGQHLLSVSVTDPSVDLGVDQVVEVP